MSPRNRLTGALAAGIAALALLAMPANAAEPPRVVVSIPPIHSLVSAVTEGVTSPRLLVRGAVSPHSYTMVPSDARALRDADLVVWVGPVVETFLTRALHDPGETRVVELMDAPRLTLLPARHGGLFDDHAHDDELEHDEDEAHADDQDDEHDAHHDDARNDGHLWLDPRNAILVVEMTADVLAEIDPERAAAYRANAGKAIAALRAVDTEIAATMQPVRGVPFIVLHDAYQYFEARYGLATAGSITVVPDRRPGARRLKEIRARIADGGAACVFAEPQFRADVVATVIEGTGARSGVADPLGATLDPGPDLYPEMMRRLANALATCLTPRS